MHRMKKEIYDSKAFKSITLTHQQIYLQWRSDYNKEHMKKWGCWFKGKLPENYTLPKQKDPINKSRLLSTYFNHPLRAVYKNASAILTWLFKSIQRSYGMFTLFQLKDIKPRLKRAQKKLRKTYGKSTKLKILQSDIKQMYSYLDHDQIIQAIIWMCGRAKKMHEAKGKRTRRKENYILISKLKNADTGKKYVRWSGVVGDEDHYTFSLDDLILIVMYDLRNSYQSRGKDVFLQIYGCPIGGFLSAIYANVKCAYDEFLFLQRIKFHINNIYGIRQMDDLILFIAYDGNSPNSEERALAIKKQVLEKDCAYKGGLELEEQQYDQIDNVTTRHKFAGTNIYVHQPTNDNIYIFCAPLNKNREAINSTGQQLIPRFIPKNSMVPQHYKIGMQMTTFLRLDEQSSTEDILVDSMIDNVREMFT